MQAPRESFLQNLNPNIKKLNPDYLYHLGLASSTDRLREIFGNVVHVAMMGSGPRAFRFADELKKAVGGRVVSIAKEPNEDFDTMSAINEAFVEVKEGRRDLLSAMEDVQDWFAREADDPRIIGKTERFWMFKVDTPAGGVISVNHHMGMPTHSILLHEVTKLLHHAGADTHEKPFEYSRLGTSGGLGIEGGDIVVANRGLNPSGEAKYRIHVLGKEITLPTEFDPAMIKKIVDCSSAVDARVVQGDTVSCDDFYTEQARLDGAFCMVPSEQAKLTYLQGLHAKGARNMEMEAAGFAAFGKHMAIPSACVGVALLNRLNGDQVKATPEELAAYSDGPQQLIIEYIRRQAVEDLK